ncbi:hypothetical protein OHB54_04735 [Streptomyces sp. NBC_01007]|nr:hypothetical protein OHB54_04735 [Streptomyces sp. NBC_01007]
MVVLGHKNVTSDENAKIIKKPQQYLHDSSHVAAVGIKTADVAARPVGGDPGQRNCRTPWHSGKAAVARRRAAGPAVHQQASDDPGWQVPVTCRAAPNSCAQITPPSSLLEP